MQYFVGVRQDVQLYTRRSGHASHLRREPQYCQDGRASCGRTTKTAAW